MAVAGQAEKNKAAVRRLLEDVMPNGRFDELDEIVEPDCVTRRAGFADLMAVRGVPVAAGGSFRERFEAGWQPISEVLRDQRTQVEEIIGEGDTVWFRTRMRFVHGGEFLGAPASGREVEFNEVGIARFNDDGKIVEVWFMCEELKIADRLGFTLSAPSSPPRQHDHRH
jgi:predicted ester cyclase